MRTHRKALIVAVMLVITSAAILAGCAGRQGSAETTYAPPTVVSGVYDDTHATQPVDQPAVKSLENPENPQVQPLPMPRAELGAAPAEAKTHPKGEKTAYLTFDDGPNSDYTEKILDILREKNVQATFMVVGKNVKLNPGVLQRILADGHGVGNHTFSHDYKVLYSSPEKFLAELDETNRVLIPYTGKPVMIFRAPGGPQNLKPDFISSLKKRGYISVGWNITSADSDPKGVTETQVYNNVVAGLERVERLKLTPNILMHDGTQLPGTKVRPGTPLAIYIQNREATISALPAIIDHFKSKGYTFKVIDENTPPAW
ncbi:MAG: polysaccharide deacetylase [Peptococcaceae bacterium]|nr:polysaccharide deacetylase [Peptococcaceae bacterium]